MLGDGALEPMSEMSISSFWDNLEIFSASLMTIILVSMIWKCRLRYFLGGVFWDSQEKKRAYGERCGFVLMGKLTLVGFPKHEISLME